MTFRKLTALTGVAALSFAHLSTLGVALADNQPGSVASPAQPRAVSAGLLAPPTGKAQELLPTASPETLRAFKPAGASSTAAPGRSGLNNADAPAPRAFGSGGAPYTTAMVEARALGFTTPLDYAAVTSYPFRGVGKLYFNIGSSLYVCSGAMIKPGVLLTAAHCVFNFGTNSGSGFYSNWSWCPALATIGAPYGCYAGVQARILTTYFNGTDVCAQAGVVCNDDMATILLAPVNNVLPGTRVGFYNYSWNGYSFHTFSQLGSAPVSQVTQLGYPQAINSGTEMIRNDAVGWRVVSGSLLNTNIGSAETGGSSGGPWFANFGSPPSYGTGSSGGTATVPTILGVTSYGSTTVGYNIQGASAFGQNSQYNGTYGTYGAGNIGLLVSDTCTNNPTYC